MLLYANHVNSFNHCFWTGAQPGILFGRGQSLTSSDFKL